MVLHETSGKKARDMAHSLTASHSVELEILYARRTALDDLIRSLEDYGRLRAKRFEVHETDRRTA
jgi:hypothetical protein